MIVFIMQTFRPRKRTTKLMKQPRNLILFLRILRHHHEFRSTFLQVFSVIKLYQRYNVEFQRQPKWLKGFPVRYPEAAVEAQWPLIRTHASDAFACVNPALHMPHIRTEFLRVARPLVIVTS